MRMTQKGIDKGAANGTAHGTFYRAVSDRPTSNVKGSRTEYGTQNRSTADMQQRGIRIVGVTRVTPRAEVIVDKLLTSNWIWMAYVWIRLLASLA
jgi:hypothetical protein